MLSSDYRSLECDPVIKNSIFLIILIVIIVIPVLIISLFVVALLSFHLYLIVAGKTTKETIGKDGPAQKEVPPASPATSQSDPSLPQQRYFLQPTHSPSSKKLVEELKPFLSFSMPLSRQEIEYISNFDVCLTSSFGRH